MVKPHTSNDYGDDYNDDYNDYDYDYHDYDDYEDNNYDDDCDYLDDDHDDWSKCVMMFACAWSNVQSLTSLPGNKSFLCSALLRCEIPPRIQHLYSDKDSMYFFIF